MTALQAAMLTGACLGLGLVLLLVARVATSPDLGAAMANLTTPTTPTGTDTDTTDLTTRFGRWLRTTAPGVARGRARPADLALLGVDPARHAGDKVIGALAGLFAPTLITAAFTLIGVHLPVAIPLIAGIGFAAALLLGADQTLARRAGTARVEVRRALSAYADLISLERSSGAGAAEAMESAAAAAPNWVFHRLHTTLVQARLSGQSPWDALTRLATDVDTPELADLAGVMRLAGEESTSVSTTLKARAAALRNALAEDAHAAANSAMQQMMLPLAGMALIYLILLALPGVLNVLSTL
ncbi:MAG: type II secretion system F family protein [Candidatus Nanopelagicales bacterium]